MGNVTITDSNTGKAMHLSEGFVPIGMQEHGGVLYIASVNKDGKGELGTIPSPIIKPLIKNKTLLEYGNSHTIATADGVTTSTIVSNKLYPGELFLMALDVCVPETADNGITYKPASSYKLEWKAELSGGVQTNSYPIITTYDTKEHPGVYDICLYVLSKTGLILAPEELWTNALNYYINKDNLKSSSMWFILGQIPESTIGLCELNKMRDEDYLKTFPGNSQPGYLVVLPVLRAPQIADFGILRRSNGLNVPYTVKRYNGDDTISYHTFFPGFWYQLKEDLEKSVYITKIKVSVYNDTDKKLMMIYWTDSDNKILQSDNPEFEITDYSKCDAINIEADEIRSYRKLQHLCVDETNRYYVITTKTNITTDLIAQNTDTGLVDKADARLTDFGGLFYVKFDENWNKWCTLTVDFWSQFDEKLGSYQCKFNPYVNDTFGIVTTSGLKIADNVKMTYGSYSNYTDYKYVRNGSTVDWSKTKISSTDPVPLGGVTVEHNQTRTTNNTPKIKLNSASYVENNDSTEVFYKWPQTETITKTFSAGSYSATVPASNYTKHFVAYKTDIRFQITKAEIYNRVRQLEDATKTWESSDGYQWLGSHTWKSGYDAADNYAFTYFLRDFSGNALANPNGKFQSLYLQSLQLSLTSGNATTVLNRNTRDALVVGQHTGPAFWGFRNALSVNSFKETTDPTYTIKLDQFFLTLSKVGKTSTVTDIYMRHVLPILDLNYTTKETFYWGVSKTPYASFIPYVAAQITSEDKSTSDGGKIFTSDKVLTAATVSAEPDKKLSVKLLYGDTVTLQNSWEPTYHKGVKATVQLENATYLFMVSGQKISKWNITIKRGDTEIYTHTGVQDVISPIVFKGGASDDITITIDEGYAVNGMAVYSVKYPKDANGNAYVDPPILGTNCCTIYEYNSDSIEQNKTTTATTTDTTENKTTYNTIVLPLASAYKEAYYSNGSRISYTCGTDTFELNRYIPPLPYVDYTFDNSGNITYYYYCLSGVLNAQLLNKLTTDLSQQSVYVFPNDEDSVFGGISELSIWQFDSSGYNKAKTSFNPVVTAVTDSFTTI